MNFSENISLQKYVDSANKQFNETESRLSKIEGSFATRMDGKSVGGIIGAIFGTVTWLAVFGVFFYCIYGLVNSTLHMVCLIASLALIGSLLLDEIISLSYYGKVSSYKSSISQLRNRVSIGRSTIKANQDTYMKSRANGWNHSLTAGESIPEEATSIETTMNGMASLTGGFINGLKNFMFFTVVIAITLVGCMALFGTAAQIMTGISGESIGADTLNTLCIIGMLITVIGEVILAKIVWSKTDCSVTNATLFIAMVGPVMFLALVAVATLLVMLVIWAIVIGAVVIAGACVFGAVSGG